MKTIVLIFCLALTTVIYSQVSIIPQPASIKMGSGTFMLPANAAILSKTSDNTFTRSVIFLTSYLETYYSSWRGPKQNYPPSPPAPPPDFSITLGLDGPQNPTPGSYTLAVSSTGIDISGHDEEGVFYGIQTFIQLLPPHVSNSKIEIPFLTIKDYPRFGYRGLHLDVRPPFYAS